MDWVSFHTHTSYSYGDGVGPVVDHVERVSSLGMKALFLSEHGNTNSHPALEQACREYGIKPGYGCEVYFAPPNTQSKFHMTLFAMNDEGYQNLSKIVTQSYLDFYQYPTVSWESLVKHNAGIVAFSGCADSFISCTLLGGKSLGPKRDADIFLSDFYEQGLDHKDVLRTRRKIQRFLDVFGDRFYLETQRFPGLPRACAINTTFGALSDDLGVPLVATADVHYPYPHQNRLQTTLHAGRRKSTVAVTDAGWEYDILLTYPESDQEIHNDLVATGLTPIQARKAIESTASLAQLCTVELPKARPIKFPVPKGQGTSLDYLKQCIRKGLNRRIAQRPDIAGRISEYRSRINDEFRIVKEKDFVDYFLVTADLVEYTKGEDVTVGPARGSAAASLICYVLGITEIDPLHPVFSKMAFERFLDPTRSDPPDIDLDFDDELRYKTPERARSIYGKENVANVGNHTKYRGKNTLQGVARAYGLPAKIFDPIGKRCTIRTETDARVNDSIADVVEAYADHPDIAPLLAVHGDKIQQAIMLEGDEYGLGIHAAGFVISSEPISDVCPIYTREKGSGRKKEVVQVIPYEKRDAEYLGFLKMDFLGLKAMGMIGLCRKWTGMSLQNLYSLFYECWDDDKDRTQYGYVNESIMERFLVDDVVGIFQYEGGTTRSLMRRLKPATFDHLAAVGALSRPGPYYGGQADEYIAVKNGEKDWDRIHPNFDKHVEWTYGQIVYQEQIMWILRDLAGFDVPTVLRVRKIIGKKLGEHQFVALWEQFRDGCLSQGVTETLAEKVWGAITTAAGYAFNIPHAYSYALVAWWQMYFKCYHPAEFFAASLAKNGDGKDELPRRTRLLADAFSHGINMAPWNPAVMDAQWTPYYGEIMPGFCQMPNIAEATAADILAWRADHTVVQWADLRQVKGIGAVTIAKMIAFTALADPLGINKTRDQIASFRKALENGEFDSVSGFPAAEEFYTSEDLPAGETLAFAGLVANVVFRDEVENYYQRHGGDLSEIRSEMEAKFNGNTKKATIFAYDEYGEVALRTSAWSYPSMANRLAAIDPDKHMVVGYGRTFDGKSGSIQLRNLWILDLDE